MNEKKIGRNDPCPCGSGLKYKKCHLMKQSKYKSETIDQKLFESLQPQIQQKIYEHEVKEKKRKAQYGEVRPTISVDFKGQKLIAVGNQLHYSKKWKTFHDFLFDYIKNCLGTEWGKSELKKDYKERHPILQWYKLLCDFQRNHIEKNGEIYSATCTGAVGAYLSLAYDLYVLRHHSLLQDRLIQRLKDIKQFQGARYEVYVTASFIKAGFDIDFEDETNRASTHCEFIATHKELKRQYSVEAKSRHRSGFLGHTGEPVKDHDAIRLRIGNLINEALKKEAGHTRIIFIDINMPPREGAIFEKNWFEQLEKTLSKIERNGVDGKPCPPAYTFFTNHPYHYVGEVEVEPSRDFLFSAVNIPTMLGGSNHRKAMKQEPPVYGLFDSICIHNKVPYELE